MVNSPNVLKLWQFDWLFPNLLNFDWLYHMIKFLSVECFKPNCQTSFTTWEDVITHRYHNCHSNHGNHGYTKLFYPSFYWAARSGLFLKQWNVNTLNICLSLDKHVHDVCIKESTLQLVTCYTGVRWQVNLSPYSWNCWETG